MDKTKKTLLTMLLISLAVAGGYTFVFLQVREASRKAAEIDHEIESEQERLGKENSLRTLFQNTEKEREELLSKVVSQNKLVGFFEELEELAGEAGVEMEVTRIEEHVELDQVVPKELLDDEEKKPKPRPHPAASDIEWLKMNIETKGSWDNSFRFLSFIELLPYHVQLFDVRLAQEGSGSDSMEDGEEKGWRLTLTAKVLRQKEK